MSKKIKKGKISINKVNETFNPTHLKFNFTFVDEKQYKNLADKEKAVLLDRIKFLSSQNYLSLSQMRKNVAFEYMPKNSILKASFPENFENDDSSRKIQDKYFVFRLYPNNIPTAGRVIGCMINMIVYIFYIDTKGKMYNH